LNNEPRSDSPLVYYCPKCGDILPSRESGDSPECMESRCPCLNEIKTYRKKAEVVRAYKWDPKCNISDWPEWMIVQFHLGIISTVGDDKTRLVIGSKSMIVNPGDYIVPDKHGTTVWCGEAFESEYDEIKSPTLKTRDFYPKTFEEIPREDNPAFGKEECLMIVAEIHQIKDPHAIVLHIVPDSIESVTNIAKFWRHENAVKFCDAIDDGFLTLK